MLTQYLYTLPILFFTIVCMLFLTIANERILDAHKKAFSIAFVGVFFVTVCEVVSLIADGAAPQFKRVLFLANYFGFLLTPILMVFFAAFIGRFHRLKVPVIGIAVYFVACNILVATKQLFFIDGQNHYHRGNLFFLYLIAYLCAVAYLFYETLQYSQKGFLQHKFFAFLLGVSFLVSCSIQVFNPEVYVTRITVIICLCIYYVHILDLTTLFDKLTGVLNQGTYLRKIKKLKEEQVLIIMDIDDFKNVNDTYGHRSGDKCLTILAKAIRLSFENHGQCYRIGGDEFAIVLGKHQNAEKLIERFNKMVEDLFKNMPYRISVSIGYCKYEQDDSVEAVVRRADANMYQVKKLKKLLKSIDVTPLPSE